MKSIIFILASLISISSFAAETKLFVSHDVEASQALQLQMDGSALHADFLKHVATNYYQVDLSYDFTGKDNVGIADGDYDFVTRDETTTTYMKYNVQRSRSRCNDADVFEDQIQIWANALVVQNDGSGVEFQLRVEWLTTATDCDQNKVLNDAEKVKRFKKDPKFFVLSMYPAPQHSTFVPTDKPIIIIPKK